MSHPVHGTAAKKYGAPDLRLSVTAYGGHAQQALTADVTMDG